MAVGLRLMRTGTTTSPAHARACCPGVVSSLKGRGFRLLARRSARKVGCRSSGCRRQQRRRFTPTTVAASTSLSTEQRAAAKPSLVSPLTRAGRPVPGADARAGVALVAVRRRKVARHPELTRGGPQRLVVLAAEVGGRWSDECQQFLRTLLRLRVQRAPPPLRASAARGWARRWWSVPLQSTVASSALGVWTMPPLPGAPDALPLGDVLDLAIASAPSRLPLR